MIATVVNLRDVEAVEWVTEGDRDHHGDHDGSHDDDTEIVSNATIAPNAELLLKMALS